MTPPRIPGHVVGMFLHLRDALYRAITSEQGDSLAPVRIQKNLARRLNATLGRPLAPRDELDRREQARQRLRGLRALGHTGASARREPAPVLVYFEGGRNERQLTRVEELLNAKAMAFTRLDIAGDEATLEFVTRKAGCERDELPVVFVADHPVGTFEAVVRSDVSGELRRLVFGG